MNLSTALGWCACTVMLSANVCQNTWRLRVLAVLTNLAFIAYACAAACPFVMTAHLVLLPINAARLVATLRERSSGSRGARSLAR